MQIKKSLICLLILLVITTKTSSQTFVNRVFQDGSGSPTFNPILNPLGLQWSKSIHISTGELVTVGHTSIGGQEDIFLVKYDADGNITFQQNYDIGGAAFNDYGTDVFEASNGDLLVCGTTDNGTTNNYDVVVLRIDPSGTVISSNTLAGTGGLNDFAVGIAEDAVSGYVFLAANTEVASNIYDYWAIKLDNNLMLQGQNFYDYTGLSDVAIGLELDPAGEFSLIGASQSALTACDYAIAKFNTTTMNYSGDARSGLPGIAQDKPLAFVRDASNNTYITGQGWNGSNFDIKTIMIAPNMTVAWVDTLNLHGYDDSGNTIAIDPTTGDIIVGGFGTRSGNHKDMISIRYNTSGARLTVFTQASEDPTGDAYIKKVSTNSLGNVYFVAGQKSLAGSNLALVGRINKDGKRSWQKEIAGAPGDNVTPSDILISANAVYAISVLDALSNSYLTTEFTDFDRDTTRKYIGGAAACKKNDLIVSFLPSAINKAAINDQVGTKISEYGDLSDFLTHTADSAIKHAFIEICPKCDIKAVKIYLLKTTDTITVSRLGQNVPIPAFWSTLLLQFPSSISLQTAGNVLKSLPNIISYSHPSFFLTPLTTPPPNDPYYSQQLGLQGPNFTHINAEGAWNIVTNGCASFVRGGLFDSGVEWKHEDFGYTGSPSSGKMQGWYFPPPGAGPECDIRNNTNNLNDYTNHGTNNAGIIAAERNNGKGIAGIAGGDASIGNPGVTLFSLNTSMQAVDMLYALRGLNETCFSPTTALHPYRYGLNFSNHSYRISTTVIHADTFAAYREQVHFCNRMGITFIAARGNDGINNQVFPACFDSSWVISVGGVDSLVPQKWPGSSFGSKMDVIAPAKKSQIIATAFNSPTSYGPPGGDGTSLAAPHVSGVVALLMSYMNNPSSPHDYKNLAPEDCEFIIQRSALDLAPLYYDSLSGYGVVNAGKALAMVEKPKHTLYHFGTNALTPYTLTKGLYSSIDTIILTEKYDHPLTQQVYNKGKYIVKTFKIDAHISQPGLYSTDSLLYYWPRHSGSYVYDLPKSNKRLDLHEKTKITSYNGTSADLSGYIYQVKDSLGNPKGWWPCDTSFAALNNLGYSLMEYSVLTYNRAVGITEKTKETQSVSLFPNPVNKSQTLVVENDKESKCVIELYDLMGRFIKTVYNDKAGPGKTTILNDVSSLPNSLYIYIIKLDDKTFSKKFIKE